MSTVSSKLTELANAIRSKTGGTAKLTLDGMISAVNGLTVGSGADIEALGVLCDWAVTLDEGSVPIVSVANYHPSYYLIVDVFYGDGSMTDWCICPDDSDSIYCGDIDSKYGMSAAGGVFIQNVRWSANEV